MVLGRHRSVGIRLTERGARYAEVESVLGRVRLLAAGTLEFDSDNPTDGTGQSDGSTMDRMLMRRLAQADQIVVGLPRRDVVCRFIDVPNVDDDQLDGLLAFEIERHLPFPLEEACFSYRKVSCSGSTARLLIMAAKRASVDEALARLQPFGIVPTVMDVSSMAAATTLLYQRGIPAGKTITLAQVDAAEATVDVVTQESLLSSRTVPLGSGTVMGQAEEHSRQAMQAKQRVAAEGYLSFISEVLIGEGQVVNLSSQGLCVRSDEPVVPGMELQGSMMLAEMNTPLDLSEARVQWVGKGLFGVALGQDSSTVSLELQRYAARIRERERNQVSGPPLWLSPGDLGRSIVEGYVTFSSQEVDGEGTVVELSLEGWRIKSDQSVRPGMVLTIEASFPELNDPITVARGRVQWTSDGEFGVQVMTVDEHSRVRLLSYLAVGCQGSPEPIEASIHSEALVTELRRVAAVIDGAAGPILLHGSGDSLAQSLREQLGTSVEYWDTSTVNGDPGTFGLALRGLPRYAVSGNLLPPERRPARANTAMALCRSLLLIVSCLALGWWSSAAIFERRVLDRLHQEIQHVGQEAAIVKALQQEAAALNVRLKGLESLAALQGRAMYLLREVVTLLPPDVVLQELSFDGTKVRLRGATTASAAMLISAFEQSALLENAAFTAPISVQGTDRQVFEIAAQLRNSVHPPPGQLERKPL